MKYRYPSGWRGGCLTPWRLRQSRSTACLSRSTSVWTCSRRLADVDVGEDEGELMKEESNAYRRMTARAHYFSVDRAEIQYAVKVACRGMVERSEGKVRRMKRPAR